MSSHTAGRNEERLVILCRSRDRLLNDAKTLFDVMDVLPIPGGYESCKRTLCHMARRLSKISRKIEVEKNDI